MRRWLAFLVPSLIALFLVGGCAGRAGVAASGPTEVKVTGSEFRYDASQTSFIAGQPYRFVATNLGKVTHDWSIAPRGGAHGDALVMVEDKDFPPGGTFTKGFTFPEPGNYEIACHSPGHYEAGMVLPITVS